MDPSAEKLTGLAERAYRTFDVERPRSLGICTVCCMKPADHDVILSQERRDISPDGVRNWLSAAWGVGDANDREVVKWMLPRILELLATGDASINYASPAPLSRLGETGFPGDYRPDEVDLVSDFLIEYAAVLVEHPDALNRVMTLDDSLEMAACANAKIDPILEQLDGCPDEAIVERVIECIRYERPSSWLNPKAYLAQRMHYNTHVPTIHRWYTSDKMLLRMMNYAQGTSGTLRRRQTAWEMAESILAITSADVPGD
ncbi:MAG: hypothetical protein ACRBM6_06900 [Geminicoccales bacterium]